MLQDGIVARYLKEHCPQQKLKLCPYRDQLPATADQFLWGSSMFNTLGRFKGLGDEMGFIVLRSLAEYPATQPSGDHRNRAATGPRRDRRRHQRMDRPHLRDHRALHPDTGQADARSEPAALAARLHRHQPPPRSGGAGLDAAGVIVFGRGLWRRPFDDLTLLAGTVTLAVLGNAFICAVISGPHDRYGARIAWVATFVVLIAAARQSKRPMS